jgi:hypothetical protein
LPLPLLLSWPSQCRCSEQTQQTGIGGVVGETPTSFAPHVSPLTVARPRRRLVTTNARMQTSRLGVGCAGGSGPGGRLQRVTRGPPRPMVWRPYLHERPQHMCFSTKKQRDGAVASPRVGVICGIHSSSQLAPQARPPQVARLDWGAIMSAIAPKAAEVPDPALGRRHIVSEAARRDGRCDNPAAAAAAAVLCCRQ